MIHRPILLLAVAQCAAVFAQSVDPLPAGVKLERDIP